jgi:two-component system chemotaxis response regulator CheB
MPLPSWKRRRSPGAATPLKTTMAAIKILIVDPNVAYRDALRQSLENTSDIVVESVSPTCKTGLEKLAQTSPAVVLVGSGLNDISAAEFTARAISHDPHVGVIVTAVENDPHSAERAIAALASGAFDFVLLPPLVHKDAIDVLQRRLLPKIRSFMIKRYSRIAMAGRIPVGGMAPADGASTGAVQRRIMLDAASKVTTADKNGPEAVVIGVSTGGPEALLDLIPAFPVGFQLPIVIVIHMPKLFTGPMAQSLDKKSSLSVKEAADGDELAPGKVYLAPGGIHLEIERAATGRAVLRTVDGPAENGSKPSVDVLFRSAAKVYHGRVIATVLTGMGSDGARGAKILKKEGAYIVAQDEASSVIWGMPGCVVRDGSADVILSLNVIALHIVNRIRDRCRE